MSNYVFIGRVNIVGAVTIPKDIREELNIEKGTYVKVRLEEVIGVE